MNKKQPLFACTFNTKTRSKQTDDQNQNSLQKIVLKLMPFWPEPWNAECHFLSLIKLSMSCYGLMNSIVPYTNQVLPMLKQLTLWTQDRVKLLQSPDFFCPFIPMLLIPSPLPMGKMVARWTQQSKGKITWQSIRPATEGFLFQLPSPWNSSSRGVRVYEDLTPLLNSTEWRAHLYLNVKTINVSIIFFVMKLSSPAYPWKC